MGLTFQVIHVQGTELPKVKVGQLNFRAYIHKISDIPNDEEQPTDESVFVIEFVIHNAEFDLLGSYMLHLAVCSSIMPSEYSLIKVQANKGLAYALSKEVKTETIVQRELNLEVVLKKKKWTFILPKGTHFLIAAKNVVDHTHLNLGINI